MTKEKAIKFFDIAADACARELYKLITEPLHNGIITGHNSPVHILEWMETVHVVQTRKAEELREILQVIKKLEDDYLVISMPSGEITNVPR